jgi:hypothetical protein
MAIDVPVIWGGVAQSEIVLRAIWADDHHIDLVA